MARSLPNTSILPARTVGLDYHARREIRRLPHRRRHRLAEHGVDDAGTKWQQTHYMGLDVHKASNSVTVAEDGRGGEIRFIGTIAGLGGFFEILDIS